MTTLFLNKAVSIWTHTTRAALVLVCLSVSLGSNLSAWLQRVSVCQAAALNEEIPAEEAPAETQSSLELIELDDYASSSSNSSQRRHARSISRRELSTNLRFGSTSIRATFHLSRSEMKLRNGCGAALRC